MGYCPRQRTGVVKFRKEFWLFGKIIKLVEYKSNFGTFHAPDFVYWMERDKSYVHEESVLNERRA